MTDVIGLGFLRDWSSVLRRSAVEKMHTTMIRFEQEIWDELKSIAEKYGKDRYTQSIARLVRCCVAYCIKDTDLMKKFVREGVPPDD